MERNWSQLFPRTSKSTNKMRVTRGCDELGMDIAHFGVFWTPCSCDQISRTVLMSPPSGRRRCRSKTFRDVALHSAGAGSVELAERAVSEYCPNKLCGPCSRAASVNSFSDNIVACGCGKERKQAITDRTHKCSTCNKLFPRRRYVLVQGSDNAKTCDGAHIPRLTMRCSV